MPLLQQERIFSPYGPSHWAILVLALVGALLLVGLGRRYRGTKTGVLISRSLAVAILAFQVPLQIYNVLPSQWDIDHSLPFQISDLAWITAAYALWLGRQWAFGLTYYWGLTLTTQAMFTPALDSPDFPHIKFIEFWGHHFLVLWAAVYLTWGAGMRPDWRSYRTTVWVTLLWGAAMLGFNALTGTNYGFVNRKPTNPSLLDLMGEWPWYLAAELVVGLAAWALITWPWTRSPKARVAS